MGNTQNFIHDIYREKVSRYPVYRDTGFAIVVTKLKVEIACFMHESSSLLMFCYDTIRDAVLTCAQKLI